MFIVMHCGGMPFNGATIKEHSLGGSETAAYYMALELAKAGNRVTLFTNSPDEGKFDGVSYMWAGNVTEAAPLGERFTFYAENTPHDVCIIQRHPFAFARKYASKINIWWLHDLALGRNKALISGHLWNVDRILCVSEFHKKQVAEVWGIDPKIISAITNGVDLELFDGAINNPLNGEPTTFKLLYSSRPERGLINLVEPGGIMERLQLDSSARYHLYVCAYDNVTPDMQQFYEWLNKRCEDLPNVTRLGALTKQQLADVMRQCDALVYPTEFEEVSCITAMEAMAAGLPFIASELAALPETCKDSGSVLIPLKDGIADRNKFLEVLRTFAEPAPCTKQLLTAQKYAWRNAARMVLDVIQTVFNSAHPLSKLRHFMRHSDMRAFDRLNHSYADTGSQRGRNLAARAQLNKERKQGYAFLDTGEFKKHYENYYAYEKKRGVIYGPEDVTHTTRYQIVADWLRNLPDGAVVMDYGCAHGHYTVSLARQYPNLTFIGVDLAASNVAAARAWAEAEKLPNISFNCGGINPDGVLMLGRTPDAEQQDFTLSVGLCDAIIAAEVVEHVADPVHLVDSLCAYLKPGGRMIITVPYGPWEAQGYREHKFWRAHLHHFERTDINEMFGHHPGFQMVLATSGQSQFHSALGSYVFTFNTPKEKSFPINFDRKISQTMPDQTITACLLVKDAEADIMKCLNSITPFVQEIVIGIDEKSTDATASIIEQVREREPLIAFNVFPIKSVLETGFAAARNATIAQASGDWILWIDSDEVLIGGADMQRYLRGNQYGGYAIKQHHLSLAPMTVMRVDLPCRIFRNGIGARFFGYVHEHPEVEMNEGLGPVCLMPGVEILHYGYQTEVIRRKRFDRNFGLLMRDREENPNRTLGKFLWIRDLAQLCAYENERGALDPATVEQRCKEGIALWDELLKSGNNRITIDALDYYSMLVAATGGGIDFKFKLGASKMNGGVHLEQEPEISGVFESKEKALALMKSVLDEKTADYESRYF